ncbi:E3 ubiquitin-protein ligase TRAIP [Zeugodacus cucurbitae]|uniref:E3 ubiquitin-protein ligase TRAIP n=1 Tax=Zeugodacus cucurbitae TaxID=28588 RepID=UPI0005968F22|nr:E3 ubiquitin-protein ligase TRAIP [Zeugodacus cucurbitae]XP_054090417.1 E3 ubiquitin-protein ligase TRAIP [Zeugodacus cucurbitae]XP_054090418.1 E3 ubiquitin-protein ligase TRAIP [Zeugodacus cucurbitae]XP_054090419.1 E3 ubiquitin-protein ligase TRAIP [Zeugodacus cucurbitae]XP_054090420.1 E3 ubiquitin-protein ligase TRAIP [Zeugodacus cucurbitae]
MLNLNCVICAELFVASDDVRATNCGHMFHITCLKQWMERSKSCPQCRTKCTDRNIFRIYFNLANLDVSTIDVGSLQEQVDNASLQIKMKEKELNKAERQIKELKECQMKAAKTIQAMEQKIQKNDFVILTYSEQLKIFKTEAKMADDLRKEVERLKQQIRNIESVQSVLAATTAEAEKMLKIEKDPVRLCTWVAALKRELRTCETKKTDLRKAMKVMQDNLRQEMAAKRSLDERISQLESENYQLQEKLKEQENKGPMNFMSDLRRPSTESAPIALPDKRQTLSPAIKENLKKIEDSNSPYLNIKSSSIGLLPLFKRNHDHLTERTGITTTKLATLKISPKKTEKDGASNGSSSLGMLRKTKSDITEKYSIMKKPRLAISSSSTTAKHFGMNFEQSSTRAVSPTKPRPIGSNLDSRLKAGGLRNFKLNK